MKKILFLASLVMTMCFTVNAQTEAKHRPFVYGGLGWAPTNDLSYSFEGGTWGTTSPTSFSFTFDATRNVSSPTSLSYWVGAKAYYTFYEAPKITYMFYVAPKYKLDNTKTSLLEFGVNPNYTVHKDVLISVTAGNQVLSTSQWNMFVALGGIYMF